MLDLINDTRHEHILSIEDPIEFLHKHKKCIVNQRELGADAQSFALGLKAALRQDPDVILVGEMRDLETIATALDRLAETGHLVFATLHTQDTAQTVDRIVDVFPPEQQQQVRVQLSVAPPGDRDPAAPTHGRRPGPLLRHGGPRADPRCAQPDPRGQDAPDLLPPFRPEASTACRRWSLVSPARGEHKITGSSQRPAPGRRRSCGASWAP